MLWKYDAVLHRAVVPGRELVARDDAVLPLALEAIQHRAADQIDAAHDLRIDVRVERIGKRRHEHPRRPRALMLVVHDLRQPLPVEQPVDDPRLLLRLHVEVAVVVVADVLLVQPRHRAVLVRRAERAAVPVDHHVQAVRVDRRQQHEDDVVADRLHLGRFLGRHAPAEQHRVLRRRHLARVQAVVDPDDRLALPRQRPRLVVGQRRERARAAARCRGSVRASRGSPPTR